MKHNNAHTKSIHENSCFDLMIGLFGWVTGCIDGVIIGIVLLCSENKEEDDDLINEIEIFVHEAYSGYSIGKKDTIAIGRIGQR